MNVAVGRTCPPSTNVIVALKLWWIRLFQRRFIEQHDVLAVMGGPLGQGHGTALPHGLEQEGVGPQASGPLGPAGQTGTQSEANLIERCGGGGQVSQKVPLSAQFSRAPRHWELAGAAHAGHAEACRAGILMILMPGVDARGVVVYICLVPDP
jgi:hypothetical protein